MRHSHDDTQARSLGHGDPDTSMAANAQAKQDDPSTAMRANRIDTTEDYGPTGARRYTARRGGQQHFRRQMTEKLMSGKFDRVVFELCCEEDSVLGTNEALASDLPQICRRFCSRSSRAGCLCHSFLLWHSFLLCLPH